MLNDRWNVVGLKILELVTVLAVLVPISIDLGSNILKICRVCIQASGWHHERRRVL